jgi:hypothetical protein
LRAEREAVVADDGQPKSNAAPMELKATSAAVDEAASGSKPKSAMLASMTKATPNQKQTRVLQEKEKVAQGDDDKAPKSMKEQFASRGTGGSQPSHPGGSAKQATWMSQLIQAAEVEVTSETLDPSQDDLDRVRRLSPEEVGYLTKLVEDNRQEKLEELRSKVSPERLEIILACRQSQKEYIIRMKIRAQHSLVRIQKHVRPDYVVGYDVTITKGFDQEKQRMRRLAQRDLYEYIRQDGQAARVELLQWLAKELKKLMKGVPADLLPLADYSLRALAMYAEDSDARPGGSQPSPGGSQPSASSSKPKNYARWYKDFLVDLHIIEFPDNHRGRKPPNHVHEEGCLRHEKNRNNHDWGSWWMEIGEFEACVQI